MIVIDAPQAQVDAAQATRELRLQRDHAIKQLLKAKQESRDYELQAEEWRKSVRESTNWTYLETKHNCHKS